MGNGGILRVLVAKSSSSSAAKLVTPAWQTTLLDLETFKDYNYRFRVKKYLLMRSHMSGRCISNAHLLTLYSVLKG